jgi:Ca-activated chloride channel homolog
VNSIHLLADFHFLRPLWWCALLPLLVFWWLQRNRLQSGSWRAVVDAKLLSHLLVGVDQKQKRRSVWMLLGGLLAIAALAGPAWRKIDTPVFSKQSALVVALDLSRSMDAADIKPSRRQRAQLKLRDILRARTEGETALVVFAAQAFVVSPLTSDAKTIEVQLSSLTTDLMPEQGSRVDRALERSLQLLEQANASNGQVLVLTDGVSAATDTQAATDIAKQLAIKGYSVSIMGVGTDQGAPIPLSQGGFLKDTNGAMVLPRLEDSPLSQLAKVGGGEYRRLSSNDNDWQALLAPLQASVLNEQAIRQESRLSDEWHDEGVWLLLPLLLLAAFAFRRGAVFIWILAVGFSVQPNVVHAAEGQVESSLWDRLWQRDDQRAQTAIRQQQPERAANLFRDPAWKGAAQYKAGQYQEALESLEGLTGTEAEYNRANNFAQLGRYDEALKRYESVLKQDPNHDDAKANRELMKKLMQSAQQNQSGNNSDKQDKQQDSQNKQQNQQQQNGQGQESANNKPQQGDSKQAESQQSDSKQADSNQANSNQARQQQSQSADQSKQANNQAQAQSNSSASKNADKGEAAQALRNEKDKAKQEGDKTAQALTGEQEPLSKEAEQWLRRVPDDPGGLWRRKFLYQYKQTEAQQRVQQQGREGDQPW